MNQTLYSTFNAAILNRTLYNVTDGIDTGQVTPGYIIAALTAANATLPDDSDGNDDSGTASPGNNGGTDLAM